MFFLSNLMHACDICMDGYAWMMHGWIRMHAKLYRNCHTLGRDKMILSSMLQALVATCNVGQWNGMWVVGCKWISMVRLKSYSNAYKHAYTFIGLCYPYRTCKRGCKTHGRYQSEARTRERPAPRKRWQVRYEVI